jgi:hypothetical protein
VGVDEVTELNQLVARVFDCIAPLVDRGSFDLHHDVTGETDAPVVTWIFGTTARLFCVDRVLHLHGFQDDDGVSRFDA